MQGYQPVPAIVRDWSDVDSACEVVREPYNSVSFTRGWGDSGYKVQVVKFDCPECGFDRMIRRIDVSPEMPNEVRYWCLNPNCVHFVRDALSHSCHGNYPHRDVEQPTVYGEGDA
jgi:predicted RNA-binding Zn-ribbon protein involved in translation (DUF1610 family)